MNSSQKSFFDSKKVWMSIAGLFGNAVFVFLNYLGLPTELCITVISSITLIVGTYIIAQSNVDKFSSTGNILKGKEDAIKDFLGRLEGSYSDFMNNMAGNSMIASLYDSTKPSEVKQSDTDKILNSMASIFEKKPQEDDEEDPVVDRDQNTLDI
jgi:hypothetical protein